MSYEKDIPQANPEEAFWDTGEKIKSSGKPAWLFSFGAYGTQVIVWEKSLEDALEIAAEWLKENAPGFFVEPDYKEAAEELGLSTGTESQPDLFERLREEHEDEIRDKAEEDLTYTESGWIPSWEWHVTEIPSKTETHALRLRAVDLAEGLVENRRRRAAPNRRHRTSRRAAPNRRRRTSRRAAPNRHRRTSRRHTSRGRR